MGQVLTRSIAAHEGLQLASIWVRDAAQVESLDLPTDVLVSTDINQVAGASDVVIDFSLPAATSDVISAATGQGKPLVCGVSGLSDAQLAEIDVAARSVAIVYDRNMSLGIAVLEGVVRQAVGALGADFAVEVHETHHIHKIDAPSGTALKLGEVIAAARGSDKDDIHYEVERRGEVPGDHTVVLFSGTERLALGHSVTTRQVFADGALRAAKWVVQQGPGRYSIKDVLERSSGSD